MGPSTPVYVASGYSPDVLYRTFAVEEYADALCHGHVRITTLEACRADEHATRGDGEEGMWHSRAPLIEGRGDHPDVKAFAEFSRSFIAPEASVAFINSVVTEVVPNAWLLCFTELENNRANAEQLGRFGVRIREPLRLFYLITKVLVAQFGPILEAGMFGRVTYKSRESSFPSRPTTHPAFLKEPDKYAHQVESRMLWLLRTVPGTNEVPAVSPVTLNIGAAAAVLCKRC